MRVKPWHVKIGIKCVLKNNISNTREALNFENRYEMLSKIDISDAHDALSFENPYEMRAKNQY